MNQSNELRRCGAASCDLPRMLLEDRHGLKRGRREHVRDHAGHRRGAGPGLSRPFKISPPCSPRPAGRPKSSSASTSRPAVRHRLDDRDHVDPRSRDRLGEGRIRARNSRAHIRTTTPRSPRRTRSGSSTTSAVLVTLKVPATGQAGQRLHGAGQGHERDEWTVPDRLLSSRRRRGHRHGHQERTSRRSSRIMV